MPKNARFGKTKKKTVIGIAAAVIVCVIAAYAICIYSTKPKTEKAVAIIQFFPPAEDLDKAVKSLHEGGHQPWRSNPLEVARIELPAKIAALLSQQFHSFELSYWKAKGAEVITKNLKQTVIIHLKPYGDEIWYISKITFLKPDEHSEVK